MVVAKDYHKFLEEILEEHKEKIKQLDEILNSREIEFTEATKLLKIKPYDLMICCDENFMNVILHKGKLIITKDSNKENCFNE